MKFQVPNMNYAHCVAAIDKAVKGSDAAMTILADLASRTVDIDTVAASEALVKVPADAGYSFTAIASN